MKLLNRHRQMLSVLMLIVFLMPTGSGAAKQKGCSHQWQLVKSTEPTCTKAGKKTWQCSLCGKQKKESVKALGHDWALCTLIRKPTCTEEGIKRCVCSRNPKHVQKEKIPALGHSWSGWRRTANPTAQKPGTEIRRCNVCKATQKRSIPKLNDESTYFTFTFIFNFLPLVSVTVIVAEPFLSAFTLPLPSTFATAGLLLVKDFALSVAGID